MIELTLDMAERAAKAALALAALCAYVSAHGAAAPESLKGRRQGKVST